MGANVGTYGNVLLAPSGSVASATDQATASASGGAGFAITPGAGFIADVAVGDILTLCVSTIGQSSLQVSGGNVSNWILTSASGVTSTSSIWVGQVTSLAGSWTVTVPGVSGDTTSTNLATLVHWSGLATFDSYNPLVSVLDQAGTSYYVSGQTTGFPFLTPSTGGQIVLAVATSEGALRQSVTSGWQSLTGFTTIGTGSAAGWVEQGDMRSPTDSSFYGWDVSIGTGQGAAVAAVTLRPKAQPLMIQGISGAPSWYQVFDGDGNLASTGAMPTPLSIAYQSDVSNLSTTGHLSLTPATTPAVNDTLILTVAPGAGGASDLVVAGGNATWTTIGSPYGASVPGLYVGKVTTAGAAPVTLTTSVTGSNLIGCLSHWTGITPFAPSDQTAMTDAALPTTQLLGGSLPPSVAGELNIATINGQMYVSTLVPGSSPTWTEFSSSTAYKAVAGNGNTTSAWAINPTASTVAANYGWNTGAGGLGYAWLKSASFTPANSTSVLIPPPNGRAWQPGYYTVTFNAAVQAGGTFPTPITLSTPTVTNGTAVIQNSGGISNVTVGMAIYGVDWPDYTYVKSVDSSTQVTATNNCTFAYGSASPVTFGWSVDSVQVNFLRNLGNLPSPSLLPPAGSPSFPPALTSNGADLWLHGMDVQGPERYSIADGTTPSSATPALSPYGIGGNTPSIQRALLFERGVTGPSGFTSSWYFDPAYQDVARPRYPFVNFPNNVMVTNSDTPTATGPTGAYAAGVASVTSAVGPSGLGGSPYSVKHFEGLNEPDGGYGLGPTASALQYANFRAAVKAGNANALAMGPADVNGGPVNSNPAYYPWVSTVDTWLKAVSAYGQSVDAISMHFYNGWDGSILATAQWFASLAAVLSNNGYSVVSAGSESSGNVSVWITEAGQIRNSFGGGLMVVDVHRIVSWLSTLLLAGEAAGTPKEQVSFYEDTNIDDDYNSWIRDSDGSYRPHGLFYRVLSEELWGKQFSRTLSFGTVGNGLYWGGVFAPANGSGAGGLVVLYAEGMYGDVATLTAVGNAPITYSDWKGVVTTVTPSTTGNVTIPIKNTPTYVRIPAANTGSVRVFDAGNGLVLSPNLALTAGATGSTGPGGVTGAPPAAAINDGNFQTGGYGVLAGSPDFTFQTTIPGYVELDWASTQNITRVVVKQVPPWTDNNPAGFYDNNHHGTIYGFSVMMTGSLQYWNGTTWVGCPTVPDSHWDASGNYINPSAVQTVPNCSWDPQDLTIGTSSDFYNAAVGDVINQTGFAPGTFIYSVDSPQQITLNQPPLATGSGTLTLYPVLNFPSNIGHGEPFAGNIVGSNSWVSFYDQNWVFNVGFSEVISTTKIRLNVTSTSYGHLPISAMIQFEGGTPSLNISEVMVFTTNVPTQIYGPFHA